MSGIDILYPGRRPDIGKMVRSIEGAGEHGQVSAVARYRRLTENGYPMLSIAGGIYPGQLQAFYELLGPNVSWFLGGGVALHKDGPRAGAAMCVKIAKESAERAAKAKDDWAANLSKDLVIACDEMFKGRASIPEEQLTGLHPVPKTPS